MDKIYTKTGDKGFTTNLLNKKYSKADIEMELQGGIDEINANIGLLRSLIKSSFCDFKAENEKRLDEILKKIQYHLYLIGIEISTEFTELYISDDEISILENEIDYMVDKTEPMKSFIYYSGSKIAAFSHTLRTLVRRVERIYVRALEDSFYPKSYEYINRLSDYFFTVSRFVNELQGYKDEPMILNQ
ncbi:cob(I)yrinic acid a,c-diamide adenosyltransferase [Clostridium swellfunianum]|uniref:cob(I)yrinic acid a,c-diamide adenosyltransferase n=1 Tax=Clostridium swellfunianum TaxID=1367462 RepID=UPI002030571D|nr:cob(I)yrinic acid a,c-diamide adenosyltransferase [Clostridium swellfunianum]MCM0648739.1 cob(I)yrinic acid a,c-diamide adenosyltransferase [Clostridium swellfunianum]